MHDQIHGNSRIKEEDVFLGLPLLTIAFLVGYQLGRRSNIHLVRATASQQKVSSRPGNITDGILGKKVGTIVTVEGKCADLRDFSIGDNTFVVQPVDGKLVGNRMIVLRSQKTPDGKWLHIRFDEDRKYRLRMYESIEKIETGVEVQPYRFQREFVVVEDLAPPESLTNRQCPQDSTQSWQ